MDELLARLMLLAMHSEHLPVYRDCTAPVVARPKSSKMSPCEMS